MAETNFLDFLSENDPLGLLAEKTKIRPKARNSVLVNNFEEIVSFFEEHNREPQDSTKDIKEFQLFCRLKAIRSSADKVKKLKDYDLYGLLNKDGVLDIPLEDILSDDPCGLLGNDYDESIFSLTNVRKSDRISPDYIARRRFCKDFETYQPMFETLRQDLENGRRKLAVYNSQQLTPNNFYVLGGVILYLKSVEGNVANYQYQSGDRRRFDGRTECIFDNGTTSDMLFRSLDKALQRDGYAISDYIEDVSVDSDSVSDKDLPKGYVYVPAPWWKTDYFEVRYEDQNQNKKYFYPFVGEGLRYEIKDFVASILSSGLHFSKISKNENVRMAEVQELYINGNNLFKL